MARKTVHVTFDKKAEDWKVGSAGASRADSHHDTKAAAIERAKEIAKAAPLGQLKIHGKNNVIQTEHTYGKDPERYKG